MTAAPDPSVSVIVPAWNAAWSIAEALESVLSERDVPLECVVVDDASTDGTADVVRAMAERDPRVVLVEAPANEGVSAARNRALAVARGEWLTFLDADDRVFPGAVGALHGRAMATGALVVVGQRIWSDGEKTWISRTYDRPDIREPGRKSLVGNPGLLFYASATGKLFHRSCTGGLVFAGRSLGDQPWTIRAMLRAGDRIEVITDDVYVWRRPSPDNPFVSITAAKHDSALRAAEAITVAIGALTEVIDEADRVLEQPADRDRIAQAYVNRLVESDFSGPVKRAIERREVSSPQLFDALTAFVTSAPPAVIAATPSVVTRLLVPPMRHFGELDRATRAAVWRLARALTRIDPALPARLDGIAVTRAVRLAGTREGRAREALAGALLDGRDVYRAVSARLRRR